MIRNAYVCAVSLAIGASAGWALHGANPVSGTGAEATRLSTASTPSMQAPHDASAAIDVAQLRAVLREELPIALAADHGNRQPVVNTVKAPVPASPELVAQRRDALQEIDAMISGGQWGNEERHAFQERLALLDPEQAERALQQVVRGLNEGTIEVTSDGPPL